MMSEDFRRDEEEEATELSAFDQALAERTNGNRPNQHKWSLRHWVHSTVRVDLSSREDGVSEGCPSHIPLIPRQSQPPSNRNPKKVWVALPWAPFALKRKPSVTTTTAPSTHQDSPSVEYNLSGRNSVNGDLEFTGLEEHDQLALDPLQRPVSQEGYAHSESDPFLTTEMISVEFQEHEIQQQGAGWIPLSPTAMEEWVAPLRQQPSKTACLCPVATLVGLVVLAYLLATVVFGDKDSDDDWYHEEEHTAFFHLRLFLSSLNNMAVGK